MQWDYQYWNREFQGVSSINFHHEIPSITQLFLKVYLTPNFFAQINLHIMWSKSPEKFLICLNPRFSIAGRNMENSGHIGSRPRFRGMGLAVYDVKTRTRRSSVSAFSLCLLASRVESPSKSFENLKEMPTRCVAAGCGNVKILKRVYRCILYHITVMNDQNWKEELRNGSTLWNRNVRGGNHRRGRCYAQCISNLKTSRRSCLNIA